MGVRNLLKTRVLERNSATFFSGCPCHIIHNVAQQAGEGFTKACGFDIKEFAIDLYYWFDKSTKRKNELKSYCTFCDQENREIVKHVSTCSLSLEVAIERSLKQFSSLKSYFLSEYQSQDRFRRLQKVFNDLMSEVYLLFLQ